MIDEKDFVITDFGTHIGQWTVQNSNLESKEKAELFIKEIIENQENAKKWTNLMTHSKWENTFGCVYVFQLKEVFIGLTQLVRDINKQGYNWDNGMTITEIIKLKEKVKECVKIQ